MSDAKIDHYQANVITIATRANKSKMTEIEKAIFLFSNESHIWHRRE